jgi:hypothetical protein
MSPKGTTKVPTPADVTARLAAQRPGKIQRATAELLARIANELGTLERSPSDKRSDEDIELNVDLREDERNAETVQAVTDALIEAGWSVEMLSEATMCVWSEIGAEPSGSVVE